MRLCSPFPTNPRRYKKRARKSPVTRNFALIPTWEGRSSGGGDPGRQVVGRGGRSRDVENGEVLLIGHRGVCVKFEAGGGQSGQEPGGRWPGH